ncbi:MAG: sigma-70 family RNA polymerase sigma factor [Planctomycetes bacterium]|nr:sigma-70 family RNA polymerase sigma factor [Planctomycetota bacterium]
MGSPEALLAHSSFVRSLASRLVYDRDDAEDVAQETLVSYLRARPDASRPLKGWFRRVIQNHVLQRSRGAGRRGARERAVARPEGTPATDEIVERENTRRAVIDALVELREPYRATLLLRFYEDLAPAQVAARLGVPVETVRTRLKRGLALLRERLDARPGGRDAWSVALLPIALPPGASIGIGEPLIDGVRGAWRGKATAFVGVALIVWFIAAWMRRAPEALDTARLAPDAASSNVAGLDAPEFDSRVAAAGGARFAVSPREMLENWSVEVVRDVDRRPLVGLEVRVRVAGAEPAVAVTDSVGKLALAVPVGRAVALATDGSNEALAGEFALPATSTALEHDAPPRAFQWSLAAASAVAGRVVDAAGTALAGATVTLFHGVHPFIEGGAPIDAAGRAVTDAFGRFVFHGLPKSFSLHAEHGDDVAQACLSAELEQPTDVVDVELRVAPAWRVRGRVVDREGRALAGATIDALNDDRRGRGRSTGQAGVSYRVLVRQRARSAADGTFEFARLPAIRHTLGVELDGFDPRRLPLEGPQDDLLFELERSANLAVRVLDPGGAPLVGANVRLFGPSREPRVETTTDAEGRARFAVPGDATVFLRVSAAGFASRLDLPFAMRATKTERELVLEPAVSIRGRVVEANGEALAAWGVTARLPSSELAAWNDVWAPKFDDAQVFASAETDSTGEFVLDGLDGREYELAATPVDSKAVEGLARVAGGQSGVELVVGGRGGDTTTFIGRVVERVGGAPIAAFSLTAQRQGQGGSRSAAARDFRASDGTFRLFGGRPGHWWVWVRADGYAPRFVPARDYAAGEQALELQLDRAVDLDVRVVDAGGRAVHGARVICRGDDGRPVPTMISPNYWLNSVPCDARGEAGLVGLPARPLEIDVRVMEVDELFTFRIDPTSASAGAVELALPLDLGAARRSVELALVAGTTNAPTFALSAPEANATPWLGRCGVRVQGHDGRVVASFAGRADGEGFRFEKPFLYSVIRIEGGTQTSQLFENVIDADPTGARDGPEVLGPGRLRFTIPLDATRLELARDGAAPFTFDLGGVGSAETLAVTLALPR